VFKTTIDEFLGQISFLKVLSGTIRADDVLVNSRSGAKERLHNLFSMVGGSQTHVDSVGAGDIVAVTKLADTRTGDTLAPDGTPVTVAVPSVAAPGVRRGDRRRQAVRRGPVGDHAAPARHRGSDPRRAPRGRRPARPCSAAAARPTCAWRCRASSAPVSSSTSTDVRVAYRATLAGAVEVEGKHKKQSGGHGQFGVATVRFEPLPSGSGFEFDSEVTGGAIPKNLIPPSAPASRRRWPAVGPTGSRSST
jgi:elongation factor G